MDKIKINLSSQMTSTLSDLESVRFGFEEAVGTESAELTTAIDDDSSDTVLFGIAQLIMVALKEKAVTKDQVTAALLTSPKLAEAFIRIGLTDAELSALTTQH
ncbi:MULTISPECIES: hypothetical protein [Donghicola]|jgi:hypothetical protein|uniref:Secreted protein n=1 Tax=Donghicola eburneus TaxID=393278 RepID=A0A1M4N4P9_9RHOB|nr:MULTISPECIES: hypothetical protein [Donghicola]MCI5038145.1 hypothetical protein [Donghicola eburneus]MCT4578746.1 hypothetical protein [Donghicola sp.]SCM69870.1 hypothetical protein KARMA_4113 [Donghicola eburneus]SFQ65460.1 hypothetical protein SAMN05421764_108221 [Donghicola eburneus]